MKLNILAGATSNIFQIFIQDSSSTTGAGLTGLAYNSASLTAYYHKDSDTTATAISLVTMTVGTFTSSGFKEIDATNMPGWYQFCPPDAAVSSGKNVAFHLKGATNMAPLPIEVQLVSYNPYDAVRLGLTALPNANASAAGGLPILGTNSTAISFTGGMTISNASGTALLLSSSGSNGRGLHCQGNGTASGFRAEGGATGSGIQVVGGATSGHGINIGTTSGDGIHSAPTAGAGLYLLGNGSGNAGLFTTGGASGPGAKFSPGSSSEGITVEGGMTAAITGNITGNLSGSVGSVTGAVGSVTGAVGSVTGNVGGNVTGSVGSVVGAVGSVTGAVGSVTGNVGGNVTGSVGSVVGNVGGNVVGSVASVTALAIKKNTQLSNFEFLMVSSTDHITPATGLTVTATRSIDGAAFASCANSVSEVGSGIYKITLATTDLNGTVITLKFTATGADARYITIPTQA